MLFMLKHAFLMAYINYGSKFILGEGLSLLTRINTQKKQEAHRKFVYNENDRCEYPHKSWYKSAVGKRNLICLESGEGLRWNLTKDKYQECEYTGWQRNPLWAEKIGRKRCQKWGGR